MKVGRQMPKVSYAKMDLTGQRFGSFVIVEPGPVKNGRPHWVCQCDCGNIVTVNYQSLVRGLSKSCGCMHRKNTAARLRTHGGTTTPEYNSWRGMKGRCYDLNHKHYNKYGGRGIKICNGWHHDFASFLADMGTKPSLKHSIDRIDNNAHYSCGHCEECLRNGWQLNCKWTEQTEQVNNRRVAIKVVYDGREMPLKKVSDLTKIPYGTLYQRYRLGQPLIPPSAE